MDYSSVEKFAFFVHPGYPASLDTKQICWIFGLLSDDTIGKVFKFRIKFQIFGKRYEWKFPLIKRAVRDKKTKKIKGWIIGVTVTAKQIVSVGDHDFVFERIVDAVNLSKKLGAKYIGLGSLISPFLHGGLDIEEKFPEIIFTNGNSFTGYATCAMIEKTFDAFGLSKANDSIAVFGATGSVGHAVSELLVERGYKIVVYARRQKELENLKVEVTGKYRSASIEIARDPFEMAESRVFVVVVSGIGLKILPEYINPDGIVIDVTRPKNTSEELLKLCPNIKIFDGGILYVPDLVHSMNTGLAEHEVFACFTETLLMAENSVAGNRVGYANAKDANMFGHLFSKIPGRKLAPFRSFGKLAKVNG